MARRSDFEGRLVALLDSGTPRGPVGRGATVLVAAVALVLLVFVAVPTTAGEPAAEHPRVREEAASALGFIGDPSTVDPLARVLLSDPDGDVREAAAWALGETESREAVARLEEALGQPAAVTALEGMLEDSDGRLQRTVLEAIAEIGSERATNVLTAATRSDDPGLRRAAARAPGEGG